MPDSVYSILLKFGLDDAAAKAAATDIEKLKSAQAESGKVGTQAMKDVTVATDKATVSKRQMREAVKGVAYEFPLLGRAAALALNPVTASVAGIIAAFRLWKIRVDELSKSLGGIPMTDVSEGIVERLERRAAALKKLAEGAGSLTDAEGKIKEFFADTNAALDAQVEAIKRIGDARNELAKSLGLPVSGEDTETARRAEDARIAAMKKQQADLRAEGRRKLAAAGGVVGDEQEAGLEQKYAAAAKEAEGELKKARERRMEIADMEGLHKYDPRRIYYDTKFRIRYGYGTTYDQARAMEMGIESSQQGVIDSYGAFKANQADRARKRALKAQGEKDIEEAEGMTPEIARRESGQRTRRTADRMVGALDFARGSGDPRSKTLMDASFAADQFSATGRTNPEGARAIAQARDLLGAQRATFAELISYLAGLNDSVSQLQRGLAQVRAQAAHLQNSR